MSSPHDILNEASLKMFGVPVEQLTREQRNMVKTACYHILYGGSIETISRYLRRPKKELLEYVKTLGFASLSDVDRGESYTISEPKEAKHDLHPRYSPQGRVLRAQNRAKKDT